MYYIDINISGSYENSCKYFLPINLRNLERKIRETRGKEDFSKRDIFAAHSFKNLFF